MDISFICVGQCAGNFGILLEQRGFNVFYINTAEGDLATLNGAKYVYHVPNSKGCNQSQDKAKAILASNLEEILAAINKCIASSVVFFICSVGGGTGGGMTPILWEAYMQYLAEKESKEWDAFEASLDAGESPNTPTKYKVGLVTIAPGIKETVQINANAYNFYRDVVSLVERNARGEFDNMGSIFIVDNDNVVDPVVLNMQFVDLFCEILSIPSSHLDVRGNVDEADLATALLHPGVCIIGKCTTNADVTSMYQSVTNSPVFAPSEGKTGVYWVTSTISAVDTDALEGKLGMPLAHFKAFNSNANYFLLSGLGFPTERLDIMAERAKEYQRSVYNRQQEFAGVKLTQDLNFLNTNVLERPVTTVNSESVADKLNKFRRRSL